MKLVRELDDKSLVVGVTKLAWMYGRSRDWAERLLAGWLEEQELGGPIRVFRMGRRGSLYTTITVLSQSMPAGKDPVVYRRLRDVESVSSEAHQRIDKEIVERKADVGDVRQRVSLLENRVLRKVS